MFDNMQAKKVQQTSNSIKNCKFSIVMDYLIYKFWVHWFRFRTGKLGPGIPNVHRGSELAELHLSRKWWSKTRILTISEVGNTSLQQRIIPRQPNKACHMSRGQFRVTEIWMIGKKKSQILSCSRGSCVSTASIFLGFTRTIEQRQWTGGKGSSHGVSSHGPGSVCNFWQIEGEREFDLRCIHIIFTPISWK